MATTQKPKKTTNNTSAILEELREMNEQIQEIYELIDRTQKRAKKRRVANGILTGILNTVGVLLGTILITIVLFFAGKSLIQSNAFQEWISEALQTSINQAIVNQLQQR